MTCPVCTAPLPTPRSTLRRYCSRLCKHRAGNAARARQRRLSHQSAWHPADLDMADAAWLAGIIDGEGTFALTHGGDGQNPNLRLSIYNTAAPVVAKVKRILAAAGVPLYEKLDTRNDRRPCSNLVIGAHGVLRLHDALRPHLTRQVDRLDAAVAFLQPHYNGRVRVSWSKDALAEWVRLRAEYNTR
jgi:endogenous inhibitor of DNA gyrase (YacG/DUF329 family)